MILNEGQKKGLEIAIERYKAGEKYTIISGWAGTGKSSLVSFIIKTLNVAEDRVCYCAYTGKAAEVLRKKGNKNACTLHKLLYESIPLPAGGYLRKPKGTIDYDIVVVDEISMVPNSMIELLFKHKIYVIGLGDNMQLPPIEKDEDNHLLDNPHVQLTEIMRQNEESEIIQLSAKIRNFQDISYYNGQEVKVMPYSQLNTGMLLWADQIITFTNVKRQAINKQLRQLLGREGNPQDGDKIICARNYWDDFSENNNPLINGTVGILQNSFQTFRRLPPRIATYEQVKQFDIIKGNLYIPDINETYPDLDIDRQMLMTEQKCCDWRLSYKLGKLRSKYGEIVPHEFIYAYAITAWKAQGSEYGKVLVLEEEFPYDKETHAKALYTACTRASDKLILIR